MHKVVRDSDAQLLQSHLADAARRYVIAGGVILSLSPFLYATVRIAARKYHVTLVEFASQLHNRGRHVVINADSSDIASLPSSGDGQRTEATPFIEANRHTSSGSITVSYRSRNSPGQGQSQAYRLAANHMVALQPVITVILKNQRSNDAVFGAEVAWASATATVTGMLAMFCRRFWRDAGTHLCIFVLCRMADTTLSLWCDTKAPRVAEGEHSSLQIMTLAARSLEVVCHFGSRLSRGCLEPGDGTAPVSIPSFYAFYDFAWSAPSPVERCVLRGRRLPLRILRRAQVHLWGGRPNTAAWQDAEVTDCVWQCLTPTGYVTYWFLRELPPSLCKWWTTGWRYLSGFLLKSHSEAVSATSAPPSATPSQVSVKYHRLSRTWCVRGCQAVIRTVSGTLCAYALLAAVPDAVPPGHFAATWVEGPGLRFHAVGYVSALWHVTKLAYAVM